MAFAVPSDWNNSSNTIEALGPGGNGGGDSQIMQGCCGGGAGAYAKAVNVTLAPGSSVLIQVPAGGSELPTVLENNSSVVVVSAAPAG